jgi:GNAT superfamily N-acetyltransferase
MAVSLTDEEAIAKGYPLYDADIAAFVGDRPVGFASNEFGAAGVWVVNEFQRQGLGTYLLKEFMRLNPQIKHIGQMTSSGEKMTRALHRQYVQDARNQGKLGS